MWLYCNDTLAFQIQAFLSSKKKLCTAIHCIYSMQDQHNVALLSNVALSSYWPSNPTVTVVVKRNRILDVWNVNLGNCLNFFQETFFFCFQFGILKLNLSHACTVNSWQKYTIQKKKCIGTVKSWNKSCCCAST